MVLVETIECLKALWGRGGARIRKESCEEHKKGLGANEE